MKTTTQISNHLRQLGLVALLTGLASGANAQEHVDIVPYFQGGTPPFYTDGTLKVGSYDLQGGSSAKVLTNAIVFSGTTMNYATGPGWTSTIDPGWTSPNDPEKFPPGTSEIVFGDLRFNVEVDPRIGVNLAYWSGSGPISFGPVPSGEVMRVSLTTNTAWFDGSAIPTNGFVYESGGSYHVHTQQRLYGDASLATSDMPATGFYLWTSSITWQPGINQQTSPRFFVVMANGFPKYSYEPVIIDGEEWDQEGGIDPTMQSVVDWVILNLGDPKEIQPTLAVTALATNNEVKISWQGAPYRQRTYQLERAAQPDGSWSAVGAPIVGVGEGLHEVVLPKTNAAGFFHLSSTATPTTRGDFGEIAFQRDDASATNSDLWMVKGDGAELSQLATSPEMELNPRRWPDVDSIAFCRQMGPSNYSLIVMTLWDQSETTLVANNPVPISSSWSPEGTQIAFNKTENGNEDIYVIDIDGSNLTRLTTDAGADREPAWSAYYPVDPSDENTEYISKIAFTSDRTSTNQVWVMDTDGQNQTNLTPGDDGDGPAWSPDALRLAFQSRRDGNAQIYRMDADGANVQRVTQSGVDELSPVWSPNGWELGFIRGQGDQSGLYIIRMDGTHERRLGTIHPGGTSLDWR